MPDPIATLVALGAGIHAMISDGQRLAALLARMGTYRLLHPERFGHVQAFMSGHDRPTDDQAREALDQASRDVAGIPRAG